MGDQIEQHKTGGEDKPAFYGAHQKQRQGAHVEENNQQPHDHQTGAITYTFHYPRNRILFIDKLSSDNDMLKQLAREWQTENKIRIVLLVTAFLTLMTGIFSIA